MPHIQAMIDTQRIMCLRKYTEDYVSPWKQMLYFLWKITVVSFSCIAISVLLTCLAVFQISTENISKSGAIYPKNPFLSPEQALNQPLWNNQFLPIGGKPIFNKTLFSILFALNLGPFA